MLYDPGRTVGRTEKGEMDPRLGGIDVMLLSSVHSDHIGVERMDQDSDAAGAICDANPPLAPTPNSNFAEIAAAKDATVVVGGEMHRCLDTKIVAEGGSAGAQILRHGGSRSIDPDGPKGAVKIAVITAHHSNGIPRDILSSSLANDLQKDGLTACVGPDNAMFAPSPTASLFISLEPRATQATWRPSYVAFMEPR